MPHSDQLIVVAGPSAVGKSTLLERLRRGECGKLRSRLGLDSPAAFTFLDAVDLRGIGDEHPERLVLHYDFLRQHNTARGFAHLPELLASSGAVTVLTLCAAAETLLRRILERLRDARAEPSARKGRISALDRKRHLYRSPEELLESYRRWSRFLHQHRVTSHWMLEPTAAHAEARPYDDTSVRRIVAGAAHTVAPKASAAPTRRLP